MDKKVLIVVGILVVLCLCITCCIGTFGALYYIGGNEDTFSEDNFISDLADDVKNTVDEQVVGVKELESEEEKTNFLTETASQYESVEGMNMTMEGQMSIADSGFNMDMNMKAVYDDGNAEIEMSSENGKILFIVYNGENYVGDGAGKLYKMPAGNDVMGENFMDVESLTDVESMFGDDMEEGINYEYLGIEDCGSLKCHKYLIKQDEGDTTVYIDTRDNLIRKMEMDMDTGGGSFEFTYGDASVDEPTNYEEISEEESFTVFLELFMPLMGEGMMDFGDLDY